jgi:hypothetical protein
MRQDGEAQKGVCQGLERVAGPQDGEAPGWAYVAR